MVDRGLCVFLWHRLRPGASCSPSQGPCCKGDCNIVSESEGLECKAGQDCTYGSLCNGDDVSVVNMVEFPFSYSDRL